LNLGIALGPTLDKAWTIVLETLQQADSIVSSYNRRAGLNAGQKADGQTGSDAPSLLANIGSEMAAVDTASIRMFESTIDFPDDSFVDILAALCTLLHGVGESSNKEASQSTIDSPRLPRSPSQPHKRLPSISTSTAAQYQEEFFALSKLGELAIINLARLTKNDPAKSGWDVLVSELVAIISSPELPSAVRLGAAEMFSRIVTEVAKFAISSPEDSRGVIQRRLLGALRAAVSGLEEEDYEASVSSHGADMGVHRVILEALKSILEQSGELLLDGWDIAFEIIRSVFSHEDEGDSAPIKSETRSIIHRSTHSKSPKVVRSSFGSLQLICSDFLSSLPPSCILILVDTLFDFCSQEDDLNISLTVGRNDSLV
jgi:hypothetical protein